MPRKWYTNYAEYLMVKHEREINAPFYKSVTDLIFYGLVAAAITLCTCAYVHWKMGLSQPAPWTVEREAEPEKPINFYWIER